MVNVWCMYGVCMVHVWCMYGVCMMYVWCMCVRVVGIWGSRWPHSSPRHDPAYSQVHMCVCACVRGVCVCVCVCVCMHVCDVCVCICMYLYVPLYWYMGRLWNVCGKRV